MTTFTDNLVAACVADLARFGNGTKTETDDPQFTYVGEYWQSIGEALDGRTEVNGKRPAWSSAFVSFCVRRAGAGTRFVYTKAHCHYVDAAMKLADGAASNHGWIARRHNQRAPRVGDIIVAGREYAKSFDYDLARMTYQADSFYPSHGDIVVKVSAGAIETIGGNVTKDTVGRRVRQTNADGTLKNVTAVKDGKTVSYPWITVLECLL
ncbi:MAG: DUF2272 domain-containing protein [Paracoccaceae bacterium]